MAAIRISQVPTRVIVFGEKQGGIRAVICILMEYLIYGSQQIARTHRRQLALNPEVRLKIRHQQGRCDSFAGDIACDKPETSFAEIQEIEVAAAYLAGLECTLPRIRVYRWAGGLEGTASLAPVWQFRVPVQRGAPVPVSRPSHAAAVQCPVSLHRTRPARMSCRPDL